MKVTVKQFLGAGANLVSGDVVGGKEITNSQASSANASNSNIEALDFAVTSFAWRKNTGSQPVPDDCPVVVELSGNYAPNGFFASDFDWQMDGSPGDIVKWKPDLERLAEMLSEEKKESALDIGIKMHKEMLCTSEAEAMNSTLCKNIVHELSLIMSCAPALVVREVERLKETNAEYAKQLASMSSSILVPNAESGNDDKKEWNGEGLPPVGEKVFYVDNPKFNAKGQVIEKWENGDELKVIAADMCWGALLPVVRNSRTQGVSFIRLELIESKERFTERLTKRNEAGRDLYVFYLQLAQPEYSFTNWDNLDEDRREHWRRLAERATVNDWSDGDLPY